MARNSCPDCGTLYSGGYCPWCNEELYIYEEQILPDGMDINLSDEFVKKVEEQKEKRDYKGQ